MFFKGWPDPPEPPKPKPRLKPTTPTHRKHPNLKKFRREMRKSPTPDEALVAAMLNHQKIRFAKQQVFTVQNGKSYIADFWIWSHRIILECDGASHETPEAKARDAERDAAFLDAGMRTVRITKKEISSLSAVELRQKLEDNRA